MLKPHTSHWAAMLVVVVCAALTSALLLTACGGSGASSDSSTSSASLSQSQDQEPFVDYEFKPPENEYDGPLFKLSQDYPTEEPSADELPDFFKTDFRKDWRTYMMQAREYCLEGNSEVEWQVEKNKVRGWYNMPWQTYGPFGREAIHGLTKEAPIKPLQLAPSQTYPNGVAYAIGFYNSFGAYTIGQVWKDHNHPDPEFASTQGFPVGTVVCKPLFLNMPPEVVAEQIPSLTDPVQWPAYATVNFGSSERKVQEVTLIQMDFMVRDERAPSGWIFGTFQYNGAIGNSDPWKNLVPVGMMWGNDPDYAKNNEEVPITDSRGNFPPPQAISATPINSGLEETVINPKAGELPPTHLGWDGRLNGPVDNPLSSCMSCHMTASSPTEEISPLFTQVSERPTTGTPEWDEWWMQWFQNVGWKNGALEKFMNATYALDFSLQLSAALKNFYESEKGKDFKFTVRR